MAAELIVDAENRTFARFTISSYEHGEVSVVGSFNGWVPGVHVLVPQSDGTRSVIAEITHPGDVHFRYLASGGRWFDDPTADFIDEYGSTLRRADALAVTSPRVAAKKAAVKKAAAKKAAVKKATTRAATKKAATESVTKKAAVKKAATKSATKKTAAKKTAAKKAATKKAATKKTASTR